MLVFTMILALFPGIGDLLFVKVAFRAPKVTSSRKGTAHRQNLYTQTPDSPHACGRLVSFHEIIMLSGCQTGSEHFPAFIARTLFVYSYTKKETQELYIYIYIYIYCKGLAAGAADPDNLQSGSRCDWRTYPIRCAMSRHRASNLLL